MSSCRATNAKSFVGEYVLLFESPAYSVAGRLGRVVDATPDPDPGPYSGYRVRMTVELPGGLLVETRHAFRLTGPEKANAALEFAVLDAEARTLVDD